MIITYHGLEWVRIQHGDTVVAIDPVSKDSKHSQKSAPTGADIVLISARHPDFNGIDMVSRGKEPFVVTGPGEYEINGVEIKGFPLEVDYEGGVKHGTIYRIVLEDVVLVHTGPFSKPEIPSTIMEEIDEVGVLFIPIAGSSDMSAKQAYKLALSFEPGVIIPIHHNGNSELDQFLKEGGSEKKELLDKVTLKKKDIKEMEGEIIALKAV